MHSIPITSLVALLTLNLILINPVIQSQTYALEEDVGRNTKSSTLTTEKENNSNNITNHTNNNSSTSSSVRDTATNDNEEVNNDLDTVEREDSTVSKASENTDNNNAENVPVVHSENSDLTLEISGILDQVTPANAGSVAYRSHNITVSATDIVRYTLQLTSANNSSELANTNNYTISGAGGNTPNDMADNTWGFAWGETSVDNQNMTYYTLPVYNTTGSDITAGILEDSTDTIPNFTKKLTFAAKFGPNAPAGNYRAAAILSVIAKPKTVGTLWSNGVDSGIEYMQDIDRATTTNGFCKNNNDIPISTADNMVTITLRDSRDESSYDIRKFPDGNCWMTNNLRLVDRKILPKDSDVQSDYTVPASSSSGWSNTDDSSANVFFNATYGAYYTWCVATAGSCSTATNKRDNASASICPKGWRLPTESDFYSFLSAADIQGNSTGSAKIRNVPYNFTYSGYFDSGTLQKAGSYGVYWSSTNYDAARAYHMYIENDGVSIYHDMYNRKYRGISVRCISKF